ncbi:MAG: iron-containing alcohol dehydrogenase [Spirochaetota bacterium]
MEQDSSTNMWNILIHKDTTELMDLSFNCICGKTHTIPIKYLSIKNGAVSETGRKMEQYKVKGQGVLVYDNKIKEQVVRGVYDNLAQQGLQLTLYGVGNNQEEIIPEAAFSEHIARDLRNGPDYLVSVGSGVISDITKYAACILGLPYMLIATAPSMNGYASSMAALQERGIKKTLTVPPAVMVFADIDLLKQSPVQMVLAGLGDIVSKSVCSADWKLSNLVKGTYFCSLPFRMTDKTEPRYLGAAEEISRRTDRGIGILTDGIMRSGLSMTVIGESTPSSGAEHLLSHYWDLLSLVEGKKKFLHGTQVGVATLLILKLYNFLREVPIRKVVSMEQLRKNYPEKQDLEELLSAKFGGFAPAVKTEYFQKYLDWEHKRSEIEFIIENWNSIWAELESFIRPWEPVEEALKKSGAPVYPHHLNKSNDEIIDSLASAPLIRGRYNILDLAGDLNLTTKAAAKILG